jgi:Spy/CpxP family protein refolding chaperone
MKKFGRVALALAGMALLAAPVQVQDKKGNGPPSGSFGGGALSLLLNKDVQKDLKLSEDQVRKINDLATKNKEAFISIDFKDQNAFVEKMKVIAESTGKALGEILKADQTRRLKQLEIQQQGSSVFRNRKVAEELKLSEEQKAKIGEIFKGSVEKRMALFRDNKDDPETLAKAMTQLDKTILADIEKRLTAEQTTTLRELCGNPFAGTLPPASGFVGGLFKGPPQKPKEEASERARDLAPPIKILADAKPINVDIGHAAPCVADLAGDGTMHLLVGQFGEGKLRIYRNAGTRAEPSFDKFSWFLDGAAGGKVPAG